MSLHVASLLKYDNHILHIAVVAVKHFTDGERASGGRSSGSSLVRRPLEQGDKVDIDDGHTQPTGV